MVQSCDIRARYYMVTLIPLSYTVKFNNNYITTINNGHVIKVWLSYIGGLHNYTCTCIRMVNNAGACINYFVQLNWFSMPA